METLAIVIVAGLYAGMILFARWAVEEMFKNLDE
jgi:hypothetical protein